MRTALQRSQASLWSGFLYQIDASHGGGGVSLGANLTDSCEDDSVDGDDTQPGMLTVTIDSSRPGRCGETTLEQRGKRITYGVLSKF